MDRYRGHGDRENIPLLSIDEFIKLAGDRGVTLWAETTRLGRIRLTDGERKILLSRLLQGYWMSPETVAAAVLYFFGDDALALDFAIDPNPGD